MIMSSTGRRAYVGLFDLHLEVLPRAEGLIFLPDLVVGEYDGKILHGFEPYVFILGC